MHLQTRQSPQKSTQKNHFPHRLYLFLVLKNSVWRIQNKNSLMNKVCYVYRVVDKRWIIFDIPCTKFAEKVTIARNLWKLNWFPFSSTARRNTRPIDRQLRYVELSNSTIDQIYICKIVKQKTDTTHYTLTVRKLTLCSNVVHHRSMSTNNEKSEQTKQFLRFSSINQCQNQIEMKRNVEKRSS